MQQSLIILNKTAYSMRNDFQYVIIRDLLLRNIAFANILNHILKDTFTNGVIKPQNYDYFFKSIKQLFRTVKNGNGICYPCWLHLFLKLIMPKCFQSYTEIFFFLFFSFHKNLQTFVHF